MKLIEVGECDRKFESLLLELDSLREALRPFSEIVNAYQSNELKNARPSWSDFDGDQDQVVLLADKDGKPLLRLREFINANKLLNVINK